MNIPNDLRDQMTSIKTFEILKGYWALFKLDERQKDILGPEIGRYMLGKTKTKDFSNKISKLLNVDIETAEKIKQRVDTDIVSPVKKSFDEMQEKGPLEESGIEIDNEDEENVKEEDSYVPEESATKPNILRDVEDPMHTETKDVANDQYSNYSPLNVVKEDVMKGIEDPDNDNQTPEEGEGTELDNKLDEILRKPRLSPHETMSQSTPDNLPTTDGSPKPDFQKTFESTNTPPAAPPKTPAPKPVMQEYEKGKDPYREPIE